MLGSCDPSATSFTQLITVLTETIKTMLSRRVQHVPPWLKASEELLHSVIHRRNVAFNIAHSDPSADIRSNCNDARRVAQHVVRKAMSTWIKDMCCYGYVSIRT